MKQILQKIAPYAFTIFCVLVATLCVELGLWQLDRLHWKKDLIQKIEQRHKKTLLWPQVLIDLEKAEHSRLVLEGRFDRDHQLFMPGKTFQGRLGAYILTPLILRDGTAVMVNRGWTPFDTPEKYAKFASADTALYAPQVYGYIKLPQTPGRFTPENDIAKNQFYFYDLDDFHTATGHEYLPFLVEQSRSAQVGPVGFKPNLSLPNNHLQYVFTWFSFAAIALLGAIIVAFKARKKPEEDKKEGDEDEDEEDDFDLSPAPKKDNKEEQKDA